MNLFDYFFKMIFAPLVIIFGLYGNLMGLVVLTHEKIRKIGPTYIYRFLFIVDTFCLAQCLVVYMKFAYKIDLSIMYGFITCKLMYFIGYVLDAISPYLLVYISIEKYVAIIYSHKRSILNSEKNQLIFLTALIIFNGFLYAEVPVYFQVFKKDLNLTLESNQTSSTYMCYFVRYSDQLISAAIDILNRLCVPLVLMTVFSTLLISAIFKSRRRISNLSNPNKQLKRDVRFAITSFSMNWLFFILNLPISLAFIFPVIMDVNTLFVSTYYIYFISYAINFYIMIATNSLFRKEFLDLILDLD